MHALAVCLLLLAPILSIASGNPSTGGVNAQVAASAGVANARQKRAEARADKDARVDKADAGAKVDRKKAKMKAEAEAKAKAEASDERKAAAPPTRADQSVCDLTPHPSWCDQ